MILQLVLVEEGVSQLGHEGSNIEKEVKDYSVFDQFRASTDHTVINVNLLFLVMQAYHPEAFRGLL